MTVGESVQIRPSNYSGVIAYIGGTEFAPGPWIGVELDTPQGKNDGSVKGVRYFTCPAKRGMFVKSQKLNLDKRGREMRLRRQNSSMETSINSSMRKSLSKGGLTSSKSRNKL
jgi:kinesin family protein 13